jgi:predicted methyltransferase
MPAKHWMQFDGFYTNPPFGASNDGRSIEAFLLRGIEALKQNGVGCLVLADDRSFPWTLDVLYATQKYVIGKGFVISELVPEFHQYHLEDAPNLKSCSMVMKRRTAPEAAKPSESLPKEFLENFYGKSAPLRARYVRDVTGGKLASRDHRIEPLNGSE